MSPDIRVVLFDHDDTLVGTVEAKWNEHRHVACVHYGKEVSEATLRLHWGKPLTEMISLICDTEDVQTALGHHLACHHLFPKKTFPSTIPALERIHASRRKIGIITSTHRFSLDHDLKLHGLPEHLIDFTQTSDECPHHKPDPRVFDPVKNRLDTLGISHNEALYIGDGLKDMQAALEAGLHFLGVETGLVSAQEFAKEGVGSIANLELLLV